MPGSNVALSYPIIGLKEQACNGERTSMFRFRSVSLDVTYRCNLTCAHCYNCSNRSDPRELSRDQLVAIGKDVAGFRVDSICMCGGEPLMRFNDVVAVIEGIKEVDSKTLVSMVSNGLLWTPEKAERLKTAGLDAVQFSVDGMTDESYDFVRQSGGQLSKVFDAMGYAKKVGLRVIASALPHHKNIGQFEDLIKYCIKHEISELRVQPLMPLGRGEGNYEVLKVTEKELSGLRNMLEAEDAKQRNLKIVWGDPIDHFYMMQQVEYVNVLNINAYGEVILSPYVSIKIWDLKKNNLSEYIDKRIPYRALKHEKVLEVLEEVQGVDDLSSRPLGLPELFLEENLDITQELLEMEEPC